jgi:hypothetical protein
MLAKTPAALNATLSHRLETAEQRMMGMSACSVLISSLRLLAHRDGVDAGLAAGAPDVLESSAEVVGRPRSASAIFINHLPQTSK